MHIVQHLAVGFVAKGHTLETDPTVDRWKLDSVRPFTDRWLGSKHLAELQDGSAPLLVLVVELDERLYRSEERGEEEKECCQLTDSDITPPRHPAAN